jgi:hypothetical protein
VLACDQGHPSHRCGSRRSRSRSPNASVPPTPRRSSRAGSSTTPGTPTRPDSGESAPEDGRRCTRDPRTQ